MPTFYRIVRTDPPAESDFLSYAALGLPAPDDPGLRRVFDGISVFDTEERARRRARATLALGRFIAAVEIATGDPIRAERTLRRSGHHTLWGDPVALLERVASVVPV